jgi:hypothetical protein
MLCNIGLGGNSNLCYIGIPTFGSGLLYGSTSKGSRSATAITLQKGKHLQLLGSSEQDHVVVLSVALALLLDELLHGRASCIQAQHHALVAVPGSMPA